MSTTESHAEQPALGCDAAPMRRRRRGAAWKTLVATLLFAALLASAPSSPAIAQDVAVEPDPGDAASKIDPLLRLELEAMPVDETLTVVVHLEDKLSLTALLAQAREDELSPAETRQDVIESMQDHAAEQQRMLQLISELWSLNGQLDRITPYWIFNGMAVTATPSVIMSIASRSEVARVEPNLIFAASGQAPVAAAGSWNLDQVGATAFHSNGYTGEGVVVAVLDSGADIDGIPGVFPSAIAGSYRGGTNSWFDPYRSTDRPYDLSGHGTSVLGVIAGAPQQGTEMSVAPGSKWIAAKIFDDSGQASTEAVHAAFQWVLDPDGDPSTDDVPDIVNNSWGTGSAICDPEFADDIAALQAAGVMVVFAAGNQGPGPSTGVSPANLPGVFSVGAVAQDGTAFEFSSRGPSICSSAPETFPDVAAPGVDVFTATLSGSASYFSGTSFAAPHVSGAAALLLDANPELSSLELEDLLRRTAVDLGPEGADDTFGVGRIHVEEVSGPVADGAVSGFVWFDDNADGIVDDGEIGIDGVAVSVSSAGPDGELGTSDDELVSVEQTSTAGGYEVAGLPPGEYLIAVDPATLPAGSTVRSASSQIVTVDAGAEPTVVDFAVEPPVPSSVTGRVDVDVDGDGTPDVPADRGVLQLVAPGGDGAFGTADDLEIARTSVDSLTGEYRFDDLVAGSYQVSIDSTSLDADIELGAVSSIVFDLGVGQTLRLDAFVLSVRPTLQPQVFVSTRTNGTLADGTRYRDEDILMFDGEKLAVWFDGSALGLSRSDVDAFTFLDETTVLFSLDRPATIDGLGAVADSDVLRFVGTFGDTTRGTLDVFLRGADVGLVRSSADIDALSMRADGSLAMSLVGNVKLGDLGRVRDEDVLALTIDPQSIGSSSFQIVFDGSAAGLSARSEDIDALATDTDRIVFSTLGDLDVGSFHAADNDLVGCAGPAAVCVLTSVRRGIELGLEGEDIDGVHLADPGAL